jgi:hypothetical protein
MSMLQFVLWVINSHFMGLHEDLQTLILTPLYLVLLDTILKRTSP